MTRAKRSMAAIFAATLIASGSLSAASLMFAGPAAAQQTGAAGAAGSSGGVAGGGPGGGESGGAGLIVVPLLEGSVKTCDEAGCISSLRLQRKPRQRDIRSSGPCEPVMQLMFANNSVRAGETQPCRL